MKRFAILISADLTPGRAGHHRHRSHYTKNEPVIVPRRDPRDKSARYYYKEAIRLPVMEGRDQGMIVINFRAQLLLWGKLTSRGASRSFPD